MSLYYIHHRNKKIEKKKTFVRIDGKQNPTSKFPPIVFWFPHLSHTEQHVDLSHYSPYLLFFVFLLNSSFIVFDIENGNCGFRRIFHHFFIRQTTIARRSEAWANEHVRMNGDKEIFVMYRHVIMIGVIGPYLSLESFTITIVLQRR